MRLSLLLVGLITAACSSDPAAPQNLGDPSGGDAVTATIDPTGGEMQVVTAEGVRVLLDFPAGALATPIELTLRPATPPSDAWFSVSLEPVGVVFLAAVDVSVELPAGIAPGDGQLYLGRSAVDGVLLPTTTSGQLLGTKLTTFGVRDDPSMTLCSTTLSYLVAPHNVAGADGLYRVRVEAGGKNHTLIDWDLLTYVGSEHHGPLQWTGRSASVAPWEGQEITLYFEQDDDGDGVHEHIYVDEIAIE